MKREYPKTEAHLRIQISEMGIEAGLIEASLAHQNVRHPARPKSTNEFEQWGLMDTHLSQLHALKAKLDSAKSKTSPASTAATNATNSGGTLPGAATEPEKRLTTTERCRMAKGENVEPKPVDTRTATEKILALKGVSLAELTRRNQ